MKYIGTTKKTTSQITPGAEQEVGGEPAAADVILGSLIGSSALARRSAGDHRFEGRGDLCSSSPVITGARVALRGELIVGEDQLVVGDRRVRLSRISLSPFTGVT